MKTLIATLALAACLAALPAQASPFGKSPEKSAAEAASGADPERDQPAGIGQPSHQHRDDQAHHHELAVTPRALAKAATDVVRIHHDSSGLGQGDAGLALVLAATVAVTGLADIVRVRLEEQHLRDAFVRVDARR